MASMAMSPGYIGIPCLPEISRSYLVDAVDLIQLVGLCNGWWYQSMLRESESFHGAQESGYVTVLSSSQNFGCVGSADRPHARSYSRLCSGE